MKNQVSMVSPKPHICLFGYFTLGQVCTSEAKSRDVNKYSFVLTPVTSRGSHFAGCLFSLVDSV